MYITSDFKTKFVSFVGIAIEILVTPKPILGVISWIIGESEMQWLYKPKPFICCKLLQIPFTKEPVWFVRNVNFSPLTDYLFSIFHKYVHKFSLSPARGKYRCFRALVSVSSKTISQINLLVRIIKKVTPKQSKLYSIS